MQGGRTSGFSISSFLRLTRFWNLVIIAVTQYATAAWLIAFENIFDVRLFLLAISTGLIAAAGYIINDYYDVKIDLINKPERVVIGKSITRRYAILFHTVLSLTGVAIGFLLGWRIGLVNFASAFFLWWYSNYLKRLPFIGNVTVAFLTLLSVEMVNLVYRMNDHLVTIYAVFGFFMTLIREIIKDMEDLKGDNTFGCKTLPIVWGIRRTKIVIYVFLFIFVSTVVVLNYSLVGLPMAYFVFGLFIPLLFLLLKLIRADTIKDYYRLSVICKIIMLLGILSMAFV